VIKIVIIEDETMLKDSLEYVLNNQDDMKVIGVTDAGNIGNDAQKRYKFYFN
jgi:DNA-binding NarL/FixJ family response regulator